MAEPYMGDIRAFAFNFPPRGWAFCDGQILPIQQNQALFSLLGTTYGGNGVTTFALPNLRGRAAVGDGQGPGLGTHVLGESAGTTSVTLTLTEMPGHNHVPQASSAAGTQRDPFPIPAGTGNRWAASGHNQYSSGPAVVGMAPGSIGLTGGSQPHPNESPYLALNFCIALVGAFPSRN